MHLNEYLKTNFSSIEIKLPLFYNWNNGLRFEIGPPTIPIFKDSNREVLNNKYFEEALYRARILFENVFESNDRVCIVFQRYSDGRQKIKRNSYIYKAIRKFDKIESFKVKNPYSEENEPVYSKKEHYHRVAIHSNVNNIDYLDIIKKSVYTDFRSNFIETFFINLDKNIIYNVYDDRGLDIVAKERDSLIELYKKFNDWILDYDREKIDKTFK